MRYRRNADTRYRAAQRAVRAGDMEQVPNLYRIAVGSGMAIDEEILGYLIEYEIGGGSLDYEIDLSHTFPYRLAVESWENYACPQTWYRLQKAQVIQSERRRELTLIAGLSFRERRERLDEMGGVIDVSWEEYIDLWMREAFQKLGDAEVDYFPMPRNTSNEAVKTVDGVWNSRQGGIVKVQALSLSSGEMKVAPSGDLFSVHYRTGCDHATNWGPDGTVVAHFMKSIDSGQQTCAAFMVEYGRYYQVNISGSEQRDMGIYPVQSDRWSPSLWRQSSEEAVERRDYALSYGTPPDIPLREIVNLNHLMDIMQELYYRKERGGAAWYKKIFEEEKSSGGGLLHQSLMDSIYYNKNFQIYQCVNAMIKRHYASGYFLDLFNIPHKRGKIAADAEGEYTYRGINFVLLPSKGRKNFKLRLLVECPICKKRVSYGRWTQHGPIHWQTKKYRRNMDEEQREIERKIRGGAGELSDIIRQRRLKHRAEGRKRKYYHCLNWEELFDIFNFDFDNFIEKQRDQIYDVASRRVGDVECECEGPCEGFLDCIEKQDEAQWKVEADIETNILNSLKNNIISCVKEIVDNINSWAQLGIQSDIYEKPERHKKGTAVELEILDEDSENWSWDAPIVCFQLRRPFLAVYAEATYAVFGVPDSGQGLARSDAGAVIAVGRWIAEAELTIFCGAKIGDNIAID